MVGRAVGVVVVIAVAGMLLTGCVAPPDPTPPPTSTPMPSQSATPAPPTTAPIAADPAPVDTVVAHITGRPEHLDLVNGAGIVVGELSYDADAGTFVDTISTALGGPPDVEERVGLTGGHIFQGETMPDQMWEHRLTARTPVPGLYLCGAATHPAGSVIALNGRNAAEAVLHDRLR